MHSKGNDSRNKSSQDTMDPYHYEELLEEV